MTETVRKTSGRFWRRREVWVPTWLTCLIALGISLGSALVVLLGAHSFLALNHPVAADTLVVEGWVDDETFAAAATEFATGRYRQLLVTGGPLDQGYPLSTYKTYAELGLANLKKITPEGTPIIAVPAPKVAVNRTYTSAVALRRWFLAGGTPPPQINLLTVGAHARRSRLLFQKALGNQTEVGILATPESDYNPDRWWTTSQGVRTVIGELIAHAYTTLFFHPKPQLESAPVAR